MSSRPWDRKRAKRNRVNQRGSFVVRFENGSTMTVAARGRLRRLQGEIVAWEGAFAGTGKTMSLARAIGIDLSEPP